MDVLTWAVAVQHKAVTVYQDAHLSDTQTLVVSVLLYASETWALLDADAKTLQVSCQRQILRIRWQDHVRCIQAYAL